MTPEEYTIVGRAFDACVNGSDDEQRRVLDQLGAEFPNLRDELAELLKHARAEPDPASSAATVVSASPPDISDNLVGQKIGAYTILRLLATGGMGRVYVAEQEQPRRLVAIKVLRHDSMSKSMWRRFQRECEILGILNHRGIARVIESGTYTRQDQVYPFYAMELVTDAQTLIQYAESQQHGSEDRLRLMIEVCNAVHEGHLNGFIHRDLKPANILVDKAGQAKVIDFGVARATDSDVSLVTMETAAGVLIGTLAYMSPEQCDGDPRSIDARTDVYSLGVILFELMTGERPYDLSHKMLPEAVRIIREHEPTRLSTINTAFRGDIETIVSKAIAKDRGRRYASAAALAEDIQRYLDDEPIAARPPSTWYQLGKFTKRNKALVGGAVAVMIASVSGTVVSVQFALGEKAARVEIQEKADELKIVTEFQASMLSDFEAELLGTEIVRKLRWYVVTQGIGTTDATAREFDELTAAVNRADLGLDLIEQILDRARDTIARDFDEDPVLQAALQQALADTYAGIGLPHEAIPLQVAAHRTRRAEFGADHADTRASLTKLGLLQIQSGRPFDAEEYLREALDMARSGTVVDRETVLLAIHNIGGVLLEQGRLRDAEEYSRQAVQGLLALGGESREEALSAMDTLGAILQEQGRYKQAEELRGSVLEERRQLLGADHPDALSSLCILGSVLEDQGRYIAAEACYTEALDECRRVLGSDHPLTLISLNNVGSVLESLGRFDEAEPYFRESLDRRRSTLGSGHPSTLRAMNNLGYLLDGLGRSLEAEELYAEVVRRKRELLGDDHPSTLTSVSNLGLFYARQGNLARAEPLLLDTLKRRRHALGDTHPDTLGSLNNIARLRQEQGDLETAEVCIREAFNGYVETLGSDHPQTLVALDNLAGVLWSLADLSQAEEHYERVLDSRRRVLGPTHPDTLTSLFNLTSLRTEVREFVEAAKLGTECFESSLDVYGEIHPETRDAAQLLVHIYSCWHAAEPDAGHDLTAANWSVRLAELESNLGPAKEH